MTRGRSGGVCSAAARRREVACGSRAFATRQPQPRKAVATDELVAAAGAHGSGDEDQSANLREAVVWLMRDMVGVAAGSQHGPVYGMQCREFDRRYVTKALARACECEKAARFVSPRQLASARKPHD